MKNSIAILGLALLMALPVSASTSFVAIKPQNDNFVRVFIAFDKPVGASEQALVRAHGGKIKYSYSIVDAIAAQVPEAALSGFAHNPHVLAIEPDLEVQAVDIELDNSWGVKRIGGGDVHTGYSNRGEGVRVGIIDSGINYNHPDLNDNYKGGYDFYYYDHDPMDVYGHGTHVAGSACAEDNNVDGTTSVNPKLGVVGSAADCDLYSLRVLNEDGVGYFSDIVASIQWSLGDEVYLPAWGDTPATTTQGIRMDVVNLSLGQSQDPGETVRQAFNEAYNRGLLIVAAAGNSGNPGGNGNSIIYPAKYDSVIAVGATDVNDKRASFSSTGDDLELVAPGVSVYSTWNDNASYYDPQPVCEGTLLDINGDGEPDGECYKYGSGTSMASPHVAGTAALVIKAYRDAGTAYTNADVRALLQSTAIDLGTAGKDGRYGYGLVNAYAAVNSIVPPGPQAPVANAGEDQSVSDADGDGSEIVTLNGSGSFDSDGSIASYEWYEGATLLATGVSPIVVFSLGAHTVTLVVTDNEGLSASDSVQISIVAPSSGISLSALGYKVKGVMKADLTWSGAMSATVDVFRNGAAITTTDNDGFFTDNINKKGGGTFIYKICEASTSACSNESVVVF